VTERIEAGEPVMVDVAPSPSTSVPRAGPSLWLRGLSLSLKTIGLLVLAVVAYAYAWRVTKIDLEQLVVGLPNVQHIAGGLLRPDLVVQEVELASVETPLRVGPGPAGTSTRQVDGTSFSVSPGSVRPGDRITFEGSGFALDSEGKLFLGHPTTRLRLITAVRTDAHGAFHESFVWPDYAVDDYVARIEVRRALNFWRPSETLLLSAEKIVETVFLALIGTTFGVLLSVPLSFLGARNLMRGSKMGLALYYAVRTVFNVTRSIEVLIIAVIMAVVVGIGPFAGVMALVLHSVGAMGKLYSEAIESIDPGPLEAITATGASGLQIVFFGVIPQVIPQFIAFTMYRWDINVRMSTVIGLVGGGGIGFLLIQYINLLQWSQAGTAIWLIAAVVMAMDYASAWLRERAV